MSKCTYECQLANGLIDKPDHANSNGGADGGADGAADSDTVNIEIINNP